MTNDLAVSGPIIIMTVLLNKAKLEETPEENVHMNKEAYITALANHAVYLQEHMLWKNVRIYTSTFFT